MKAIRRSWNRIWFSPFDPLSVSVFRLCLGLLLIVYFIANFPNWERFFAADGMLSLSAFAPQRPHISWSLIFHWTEGIVPLGVWWWLGFLAAIGFAVGYQTRLCTVVLFVLIASMVHRNLMIVNGEDLVFRMLLLYCCFAPLNATLSIDSYRKRRKAEREGTPFTPTTPTIWAVRLMQINIALIYAISLPYKLVDDVAWLNGTALYWATHSNLWTRWPSFPLFYSPFLIKVMTYGTILVEGSFPLLVWFRPTRLLIIIAMASMHIGIAIMLQNVTFFTLAMVCSFWVFVPAPMLRQVGRKVMGYAYSANDVSGKRHEDMAHHPQP